MDSITIEKMDGLTEVTISGMLSARDQTWNTSYDTLTLAQPDGYKICLVSRLQELAINFGPVVKLCYWVADNPTTKDELVTAVLHQLEGSWFEVEQKREIVGYSEWTSWTVYTTSITLGSHDLFKELFSSEGKFVMLEFTFGGK